MLTTQRQRQPGVTMKRSAPHPVCALLEAPWRFELAQAVRLLLRWLAAEGVSAEQAYADVLRFQNSLSLSFPASDLEAVTVAAVPEGALALAAGQDAGFGVGNGDDTGAAIGAADGIATVPASRHVHITPAVIGLLGLAGGLPLHDTERVAAMPAGALREGARAFFDVCSSRLVALYCQAGEHHRLEHGLATGGPDGLLPLLLALSGAVSAMPADRGCSRDGGNDDGSGSGNARAGGGWRQVAARHAALLRMRPVSAAALQQVLSDHFGVAITCVPFAGGWETVPEQHRSTLGRTFPQLGRGAMLGTRLWRPERGVRLDIGPLPPDQLERFLPGGDASLALAQMLRLCGAPSLTYEVRLLLSPDCVTPLTLHAQGGKQRLGWDSFLPDRSGRVARPTIRYVLPVQREED